MSESTGRTEMVGRPPKQEGRIVVRTADVPAFESVNWVAIGPTDMPLSGRPVPGQNQPTEAELLEANTAALRARVLAADPSELEVILEENGGTADLDALETLSERCDAVAQALGLVEKRTCSKPDPLAGKSTEEIRSELEQARLSDEESAAKAAAGELLAQITKANTAQLRTIVEEKGLSIDGYEYMSRSEKRNAIALALGLVEDEPAADGDGDGDPADPE
jgi:hypothetical protein